MSKSMVYINRKELEKVLEHMTKFECDDVELVQWPGSGSGIGTVLQGRYPVTVAGTSGVYIVEISGVEDW